MCGVDVARGDRQRGPCDAHAGTEHAVVRVPHGDVEPFQIRAVQCKVAGRQVQRGHARLRPAVAMGSGESTPESTSADRIGR